VILNGKLGECRATISHEEANLFVGLTTNLSKIVTSSEVTRRPPPPPPPPLIKHLTNTYVITQTDGNKQSALLSLEILCRNFGDEFAAKFVELLPVVVTAMSSTNHHVVSSSLLCVASLW
jgi:hypothetical protein